jgi:hypothetical protein
LSRFLKNFKVFALILLISALFLPAISSVKAQGQDTVNILPSVGGTTDPTDGTYNYNDGIDITLTATPAVGYEFVSWTVSSTSATNTATDNPFTFTVTDSSYSIQAIFNPISFIAPASVSSPNNAIVVILAAGTGGTTNPNPGTYAIADASQLKLTATANSGYKFVYWVISGNDVNAGHGDFPYTLTPTDNPYTVGHGYGATYYYQPVFVPVNSNVTTPTPTPASGGTIMGISTDTAIIIALAVVLVIVLVAFGAFAYMKRGKK